MNYIEEEDLKKFKFCPQCGKEELVLSLGDYLGDLMCYNLECCYELHFRYQDAK